MKIINNPQNISIPFKDYAIGSTEHDNIGVFDSWNPSFFDGITCKDNNKVFESKSRDSYISIDSPPLNGQLTGNLTVEFWVKIADNSWTLSFLRNKNILSLTDADT